MVKNDFFQKSKKNVTFHPLRGPTFQVSGVQHKKCGLWRWDRQTNKQTNKQTLGRIQTFLACPRYRIRSTYMGLLLGESQRTGMGKAPTSRGNDSPAARALRINYQITSWLNNIHFDAKIRSFSRVRPFLLLSCSSTWLKFTQSVFI